YSSGVKPTSPIPLVYVRPSPGDDSTSCRSGLIVRCLCDTPGMTRRAELRIAASTALVVVLSLFASCQPRPSWNGSLEDLLLSQPHRFARVMANPERHRVQVIYTQIERDENNRPLFRSFSYRLNDEEYFYPASTVKLPVALLALEKINRLDVPGLDRDTVMLTGADGHGQTEATRDPTAAGGLPSVGHYIRKVLLVSDNDAINRLYEFVGQAEIYDTWHSRGFEGTRILHRLDLVLDVESNRHTNPVRFVDGGTILLEQPGAYSPREYRA